jgi:hypothetical protein
METIKRQGAALKQKFEGLNNAALALVNMSPALSLSSPFLSYLSWLSLSQLHVDTPPAFY